MQLIELRLASFGKFQNKQITLKEGINLIYGENEAGKSTIHAFIKGMLFGIEKSRGRVSKEDTYEKYKPWDNPGAYHGSMDIKVEGKRYRIIRNFDKNNKSCTIIDMETGREYNNPEDLTVLLQGLTESGFRNTISVEQLKSRTDQDLAEEVRNYIANLSLAKSQEVDVKKALAFLTDKKKALEAEKIDDRLQVLKEEMEDLQKLEVQAENLTLKLKEVEDEEELLLSTFREKLEKFQNHLKFLEQFPIIKVKYQNYKEAKQEKKAIQGKQAQLNVALSIYKEGLASQIRKQLTELEQIKEEIEKKEEEKNRYRKEQEIIQNNWKRIQMTLSLLFLFTGAVLMYFFMDKNIFFVGLGSAILLGGVIFYLYMLSRLKRLNETSRQEWDNKEQNIKSIYKKMNSILAIFQAENEKMLKAMYEDALRQEMSLEHLKKQSMENQQQEQVLDSKISAMEREIWAYIDQLEEIYPEGISGGFLEDQWMEEIEVFIQNQKETIHARIESYHKESEALRIQKEKLKWELQALEGWEDKLFEKQQLYEDLKAQKAKTDLELEAIRLSIETINSLSVDIHDSFGKQLNELVSELSNQLTGQKYQDIKVDEKLNIKAGYKDNYVLINRLSAGTIEQLYLALRLAVGDLVYGPGIMPILIDDGFALYDDKRATSALSYLANNRSGQVILFTCHNREKDILDKLNLDYHYINLTNNEIMA